MDIVPSDILLEIFHENVIQNRNDPSALSPLQISHVCQRWREESLSFGALWSYLHIEMDSTSTRQPGTMKQIFDTWIQRSNEFPLNFTLHFSLNGCKGLEVHHAAEHMITTLIAQHQRWGEVDFQWLGLKPSPDFSEITLINMPMLSSLALRFEFQTHTGEAVRASISIAQSRRLEKLNLFGNFVLESGEEPILTLKGPCSLHLELDHSRKLGHVMCLDFLKIAPNLEELEFQSNTSSETRTVREYDSHAIESNSLRVLRFADGRASSSIIRAVTLPSLNVLQYHSWPDRTDSFLTFFQNSRPPLTYLDTSGSTVKESTLIPTLRLLPTLEELHIQAFRVPKWLFEALTLRDMARVDQENSVTSDIICPRLGSFRLATMSPPDEFDTSYLDSFCTMLKSRWMILQTFKAVWLDEGCDEVEIPVSDEGYVKLRDHFEDGSVIWVYGDAMDPRPLYS